MHSCALVQAAFDYCIPIQLVSVMVLILCSMRLALVVYFLPPTTANIIMIIIVLVLLIFCLLFANANYSFWSSPVTLCGSAFAMPTSTHQLQLSPFASSIDCALCCAGPDLVGGGGCSYMLFLHPMMTSLGAGPDLCTCVLTLAPFALWYSFINWCKHCSCTCHSCHQVKVVMVLLFCSATGANTAPALEQQCGGSLYAEVEIVWLYQRFNQSSFYNGVRQIFVCTSLRN